MSQTGIQDPVAALIERAHTEGWPSTYTDIHTFRNPELASLAAIWREKAGDRPAPAREDMDARSLKHVLRRITIVERVTEGDRKRLRIRLIGSEIVSRFGDDTGRYIDEVIPANLLPRWEVLYNAVLDSCRPVRIWTPFDHPRAKHLAGETLLLPLLGPDGKVSVLLTATFFFSRVNTDDRNDCAP
jgi:hypothetical protein